MYVSFFYFFFSLHEYPQRAMDCENTYLIYSFYVSIYYVSLLRCMISHSDSIHEHTFYCLA